MTERACLRLTQDGRCSTCGGAPMVMEAMRDGRSVVESSCQECNAYRVDPKEPLQQQSVDETFMQTLTQNRLSTAGAAC